MSRTLTRRRVVVTGYGMITPLGRDTEETFRNASQGLSGIGYLTSFDTRGLPCQIGGEVKDSWLDERPDPQAQCFYKFSARGLRLTRIATIEAANRAQIDGIADRARIGVSLGYHADNPSIEDIVFLHKFYDTDGRWNMRDLMKTDGYSYLNFLRRKPDVVTSILSILFHCKGPNLSIVSACAAGSQAIGEAHRIIQEGGRM